jgi:hypothetical protein
MEVEAYTAAPAGIIRPVLVPTKSVICTVEIHVGAVSRRRSVIATSVEPCTVVPGFDAPITNPPTVVMASKPVSAAATIAPGVGATAAGVLVVDGVAVATTGGVLAAASPAVGTTVVLAETDVGAGVVVVVAGTGVVVAGVARGVVAGGVVSCAWAAAAPATRNATVSRITAGRVIAGSLRVLATSLPQQKYDGDDQRNQENRETDYPRKSAPVVAGADGCTDAGIREGHGRRRQVIHQTAAQCEVRGPGSVR